MSGPKVVRIVTREEIEATCHRHIAAVAFAAEELRRRAGRCGKLDTATEKAIASQLSSFKAMFAAGQWMNIQKAAPEAAAFMLAEADRLEASATATAARARERGRRTMDAARSLVSALETSLVPVPAALQAAAQGKASSLEAAESAVSAALSLTPSTRQNPGARTAASELAGRLGAGEKEKAVGDLIADRSTEPTVTERRLDALIAELGILDGAGGFAAQADQIVLLTDPARRALLTDSLVMDAAAHVSALRRREAMVVQRTRALASLADVPGIKAQTLRDHIASFTQTDVAHEQDDLIAEAAVLVEESIRAHAAAARRRAVLAGLSSLGYEVRETMASAWERDGRLVVRKLGASDYGIELGAPADVARLQVRLVGAAQPTLARDARRDADQETIWCSEFDRLREGLATAGGELIVEKALLPGEQPVRTVVMPEPAAQVITSTRGPIERRFT